MFEEIKDKKVLITGASTGIGASTAKLFAENGAHVGLHYRSSQKQVENMLKEILKITKHAKTFKGDLLDIEYTKSLVPSFIKAFEGIDVLINNAGGICGYKHFSELDEESWDNTFSLNIKSPFYLIKDAFNYMMEHGGGRIINISTASVKYGASAMGLHYTASKAALDSLTLGFSKEGARHNILVNSIRCGVIDTAMRTKIGGYNEELFQKRINLIPLKRVGKPIDISRMALYLSSECGDFITGEIFTVAGGD